MGSKGSDVGFGGTFWRGGQPHGLASCKANGIPGMHGLGGGMSLMRDWKDCSDSVASPIVGNLVDIMPRSVQASRLRKMLSELSVIYTS